MPNWCYNCVTIHNEDSSKIDQIEEELKKEDPAVAQLLCPRPDDVEEWYDWNVNHWGTKWDLSILDYIRDGDNEISFYFDSAWAPPLALYDSLFAEGYEVTAYYHESGMGYCGKYEDGQDYYYEYVANDLQSLEELPEDIENFAGLIDYYNENKEDETEVD